MVIDNRISTVKCLSFEEYQKQALSFTTFIGLSGENFFVQWISGYKTIISTELWQACNFFTVRPHTPRQPRQNFETNVNMS